MKIFFKILLLFHIFFFAEDPVLYAQTGDTLENIKTKDLTNYDPDEYATPPDGDEAYKIALAKEVKYPKEAIDAKVSGTVWIRIEIEATGQILSFKIRKDIGYGCGNEALRALKELTTRLGKWSPAKFNGVPCRSTMWIPVKFVLPKPGVKYNVLNKDSIYLFPDEAPKFPGGNTVYKDFIKRNLKYPIGYDEWEGFFDIFRGMIV